MDEALELMDKHLFLREGGFACEREGRGAFRGLRRDPSPMSLLPCPQPWPDPPRA